MRKAPSIVAGIGCRAGTGGEAVVAAVDGALSRHRLSRGDLRTLATSERKAREPGLQAAVEALGLSLAVPDDAALSAAAGRSLTRSQRSEAATGLTSLSEAAALAAAGPQGRLLGARLAFGPVTCALAEAGGPSA